MADAEQVIRIRIDASQAEAGARRLNTTLSNIGRGSAANDNAANSFRRMAEALSGTHRSGSAVSKVMDEIRGRSAAAVPAVGNLVSSLSAMGPMAAIIGGVALAIGAVAVASINAAQQTQKWKANLLTVTKSSEAAQAAYNGLVSFANKTPFTLEQSVSGFVKLRALGLATSEDIMMSYGNTAAAMGKDMSQMIEAVADATTGEFERLKEFGIKAKQSGDSVAFTFQGVTTKVGKNSKEIQDYLVGIGKAQFGGAMARQMDTISGAFSNLSDKVFLMFARMGEGQLGKAVAGIANALADGVAALTPLLGGVMDVLGGILNFAFQITKGIADAFSAMIAGSSGAYGPIETISIGLSFIGETAGVLGSIIGQVFGFIGGIVGEVASFLRDSFGRVFDWLMPATQSTGQTMGESFVGVLRAAQYVAGQLPNLFKAALAELKTAFTQTGEAISASLQGDFSKWSKIDLSFGKTGKTFDSIVAGAGKTYSDQKANRAWIDNAAGRTGKGDISFDALGKDKPSAKKDKDAEDRIKKEQDFWKALQDEAETAKLIGIEGENYKKQLELQKVLGRAVNDNEKQRLGTAMQLVRTNQFLADAQKAHLESAAKAGIEEELTKKRIAGLTDDQLDREREVLEFRNDALTRGIDLQSAAYKKAEEQLRTDNARLDANKKLNDQLARATGLAEKYSAGFQKDQAAKALLADRSAADTALAKGSISPQVYKEILDGLDRASGDAALGFKDEFGQRIQELGQQFGGTFGNSISKIGSILSDVVSSLRSDSKSFAGAGPIGSIMDLIGRKQDQSTNELGKSFQQGASKFLDKTFKADTWADPLKSMSSGFGDFKKDMGSIFGKGGSFSEGLGNVLGGAAMGQQIGSQVAGMGKMLWGKFSSTGSQLGGAVGSVFGPLGSLAGSVLGGVVGGLMKKTKWGTTSVVNGSVGTAGNSGSMKDNSATAGNSISSSVENSRSNSALVSVATRSASANMTASGAFLTADARASSRANTAMSLTSVRMVQRMHFASRFRTPSRMVRSWASRHRLPHY